MDFKPNAWLIVHPDETVTIFVSKSEMGQGVATGMPTLVAEELDIPISAVRIEFAPAAPAYMDGIAKLQITGGSESTMLSWLPPRRVGATGRAMLVAAAAKGWGVDPATCTTKAGSVRTRLRIARRPTAASPRPQPSNPSRRTRR